MRILIWIVNKPLTAALSLVGCLLMSDASSRLLPRRGGKLRRYFPPLLFWMTIQMPSWIGDENPLFMLFFYFAVFEYCYGGPRLARLVTGAALYTLIVPLNMMLDSSWHWGHFLGYESTAGVFIKCAMYALVCLLVRQLTRKSGTLELSVKLWSVCGLLLLAPLIAALSFSIWNSSFSLGSIDNAQLRLAYTILPFSMLSAAALLVALATLSRQSGLEKAARLADMRELYYQSLQGRENQIRALRHDLANHLSALQGLLESGETERAKHYLGDLCASPALHGARRICENETANAVLTNKLEAMKQQGIEADALVTLPKELSISDVDLCALLGNALDNAVEAAANAQSKIVLIRARSDRGMLMLRVENTFAAPPALENGIFKTSKGDALSHGFGIRGMKEIAERCGGTLETRIHGDRFELLSCIPLK